MPDIAAEIRSRAPDVAKLVFSSPAGHEKYGAEKIIFRRVSLADPKKCWQCERFVQTKAFQENLSEADFFARTDELLAAQAFRQINLFTETEEIAYRVSKKGKIARSVNQKPQSISPTQHNRKKNYLIEEGDNAPILRELGVFTAENRIVRSMYDKYRQINRFLELLDHSFRDFTREEISILDFGCGKSYLTFIVYYYFREIRKMRVRICGYDLKDDVVEHCNALAKKYGYVGLSFVTADVKRDRLSEEKCDMVISLHACDTATDFALAYAVRRGIPYIFSVPCCQHEINASIRPGGDFDTLLRHGVLKERFSALLTDSFRADILEAEGYEVDVLEFVDFAHSPKNLMLRAKKKRKPKPENLEKLRALADKYGFSQTLLEEMKQDVKK